MDVALSILEALADGFPSERDVLGTQEGYDHNRWREAFVGFDDSVATLRVDQDVAWLLDNCPSPLTRNQILAINGPDAATQSRRILIASLMWGYGTGSLYRKRLVDIGGLLADPRLDDLLGRCRDRLTKGDIELAYQSLTSIPGIRSAFFTKFLYFLGRSLDSGSEYPLILDTLVSESLAWLTGYRELVELDSYWPKSNSASYAAYVTRMHGWARQLGTTADVIEFYLWHPPRAEFGAACRTAYRGAGAKTP